MGNTIGGKDRQNVKIMKITGETLKLKAPVEAGEILKDHPGLVLLESESVKHYGTRAKPLGPHKRLEPGRLYFLVELPEEKGVPRRVRSWINMSAKDRLESLMLARRSASDLSVMAKPVMPGKDSDSEPRAEARGGEGKEAMESGLRVTVRLPKAEVERLMRESRNEAEAVEKIMRLYMEANKNGSDVDNSKDYKKDGGNDGSTTKTEVGEAGDEGSVRDNFMEQQPLHLNGNQGSREEGLSKREKRVSFMSAKGGGMQIPVAS